MRFVQSRLFFILVTVVIFPPIVWAGGPVSNDTAACAAYQWFSNAGSDFGFVHGHFTSSGNIPQGGVVFHDDKVNPGVEGHNCVVTAGGSAYNGANEDTNGDGTVTPGEMGYNASVSTAMGPTGQDPDCHGILEPTNCRDLNCGDSTIRECDCVAKTEALNAILDHFGVAPMNEKVQQRNQYK